VVPVQNFGLPGNRNIVARSMRNVMIEADQTVGVPETKDWPLPEPRTASR
jgi:hypothetical protein